MAELFLEVLNQSMVAGWLILAILVVRLLLRKAPRWICCGLWALVGIRLIFPFSLESVFSLIPSTQTLRPDLMYTGNPTIQGGTAPVENVWNPAVSGSVSPEPAASVDLLQTVIGVVSIIWLIGMAVLILYAWISYIRLRIRVRTAVRWKENLWRSEFVDAPFILGILRPRIYLPYHMDETELELVLGHERAHLKRLDHWWKPLGFVLLAVYWFHPLCWVAYLLFCKDIEIACDEYVIRFFDEGQRKAYSMALLNYSGNGRRIAACPLAFGEVNVKERIKTVLSYKKPAFWIIIVAIIACAVVAVCFMTTPKQRSEEGAKADTGHSASGEVQTASVKGVSEGAKSDDVQNRSDGTSHVSDAQDISETKADNVPDIEDTNQAAGTAKTSQADTLQFGPEDMHDLVKMEMLIGSERMFCEDEDALRWVEEHFSQAEAIDYPPGCSWDVQIFLTRADGSVGVIYPATDSCDIFKANNVCYDFGDSDNSEFWGQFDGWYDRICECRENSRNTNNYGHHYESHHSNHH